MLNTKKIVKNMIGKDIGRNKSWEVNTFGKSKYNKDVFKEALDKIKNSKKGDNTIDYELDSAVINTKIGAMKKEELRELFHEAEKKLGKKLIGD